MNRRPDGLGSALVIGAAVVVVAAGISFASSILGWILLSVFFAILVTPLYTWLQRRGLPTALALLGVALILIGIVASLGVLVGVSVGRIVALAPTYQAQLSERLADAHTELATFGIEVPTAVLVEVASPGLVMRWFVTLLHAISSVTFNFLYILLLVLFLLADGPSMMARMRDGLGASHPLVARLDQVGPKVARIFGIRAYINLLTAAGVAAALWLLGIDFALLWGALLFFMSFVPYIGIFVASAPPVLLALVEYGVERALLVIVGITVINLTLENVVMPRLVGSSLSLTPTFVLVSFFLWIWLLGASGALLAVFLSTLMIVVLDSYERTRWLAAALMGGGGEPVEVSEPMAAPAEAPVRA
jgi:predicted PurR-regulated permease PerM